MFTTRTVAVVVVVVSLLSPSALRAQGYVAPPVPLWDLGAQPFAGPGLPQGPCPTGRLPIGDSGSQGHLWKLTLANWLATVQPSAVTLPAPVPVPSSFATAWGLYYTPPGGAPVLADSYQMCHAADWGAAPADWVEQVETLYLASAATDWDPYTLSHMQAPAAHFDLAELENTSDCRVHVPDLVLDAEISAWANIAYDGNPYSTLWAAEVKTRGAVWLAMNLIIADYLWWTTGTAPEAYGQLPADPVTWTTWPVTPRFSTTGRVLPDGDYVLADGHSVATFHPHSHLHFFSESGAMLAHFAETYWHVHDALPTNVQMAIEEALLTFAERVEDQRTVGLMANLDHRSLVGLFLASEVQFNDPGVAGYLYQLYAARRDEFYDPNNGPFWPQGSLNQLTGFDTGYGNWDLLHVAKLRFADPTPGVWLTDAARRLFDLWGHLLLPEQSTSAPLVAPVGFNSRTGTSAVAGLDTVAKISQTFLLAANAATNGQPDPLPWAWAGLQRVYGWIDPSYPWASGWQSLVCGFLIDAVKTHLPNMLRWSGYPPPAQPEAFPDPEALGYLSRSYHQPNFARLFGDHALFSAWDTAAQQPQPLPFELPPPYFHAIEDAFFFARPGGPTGDMSVIVHAGPVGTADADGFGGGQLAGLATPQGGTLVLSRRRGHNNPPSVDDPLEWRSQPIHAVTMATPGTNDWTSSARIARPSVYAQELVDEVTDPWSALALFSGMPTGRDCVRAFDPASQPVSGTSLLPVTQAQFVRVCGAIPEQAFGGPVLPQPIMYQRDMLIGEGGVTVETLLRPGAPTPLEAYETIPLYFGYDADHPQPDFTVTLEGVTFTRADLPMATPNHTTTAPEYGVRRVIVTRHGGGLIIDFLVPQTVLISESWANGGLSWNLLIDLDWMAGAMDRDIAYVITPL